MTAAESDVVGQLMLGLRPKAIAVARGVSEHTVRTQIRSILDKADVNGVRELVFLLDGLPPASAD
jgi:DNA-binding CsgD family transcriptional regulator